MDPIEYNIATLEVGTYVGRVWRPHIRGPSVVRVSGGHVVDITSRQIPTIRDLCECDSPWKVAIAADGEELGSLEELLAASLDRENGQSARLLAPPDLQVIKAAGVTFGHSMLERVIEEKARGDPALAETIRREVVSLVGDLSNLVPGSSQAEALKKSLMEKGVWSQYLEVGIGPDAEIFTKAPVMSAVGFGADIGIHPMSKWNNPEPEVAIVVSSQGSIVGATLGNDVNLRDVEGRSALLLSKAKDNNASCALGPFIRLFDDGFSLDDVEKMDIQLTVSGEDGFLLEGISSMSRISRSPASLAGATLNEHHAYPDGFMLMLGTLFAPTQDRGEEGQGFTHAYGDRVTISSGQLGMLCNRVRPTHTCPAWDFSASHLMRNLAARNLL